MGSATSHGIDLGSQAHAWFHLLRILRTSVSASYYVIRICHYLLCHLWCVVGQIQVNRSRVLVGDLDPSTISASISVGA